MPRNGSPTWLSWLAPIIVLWVMTLVTVDAELSSWDVAGKLEAQGFVHSANALRAAEHNLNIVKRNRFLGFRFEITEWNRPLYKDGLADLPAVLQTKADAMFCFGWAQHLQNPERVVGEARCGAIVGDQFLQWLEGQTNGSLHALVYDNTKIKLHFSDFAILDHSRQTCFEDAPHQCAPDNMPSLREIPPDIIWLPEGYKSEEACARD